eukprot:CAMPEP_0174359928 /NCGR_PEP_ID=MMETSP0811_2-20130205/51328_1 /TAXON_ID=73025 ORGANISM="Eutreptiella gymnastica-like, Strain CCMP1594" /NCGR_SAMPLE_ID=MMETSP0811_2 /ASSEMBLY_ACC=CAM_ASM_000667 /LENGTH=64 /DNA_ID=CAMNT_0015495107 /DNA_START=646 /DNA_END=840 /DNA_ORIENTATION=-
MKQWWGIGQRGYTTMSPTPARPEPTATPMEDGTMVHYKKGRETQACTRRCASPATAEEAGNPAS